MKFTNGNWLVRDGFSTAYPAEAYQVDIDSAGVTVYAPCHPITSRGATLQGPVLTIRYSSPMPDVIRVKISHFMGDEDLTPAFRIKQQEGFLPIIERTVDAVTLTSGSLAVKIHQGQGWKVEYLRDGNRLTGTGYKGTTYAREQQNPEKTYIQEQLELAVGEYVYGLGERFTAFVKNGQVVESWNEDGGTSSEQTYKNIPFYMTNQGYGVFVNHPERVSFEIASEFVSKTAFSVEGESLEYFVINGPTPKQVLQNYTALTGKPALPPAWSFGLWLTTSFTTSYDEETVNSFVDGMADRDLPLHVFHFDCFWMKEFEWCNFEWDERVFPDPQGMLTRLKEKGLKICVWINPYIGQKSPLFAEGKSKGYLLKKSNGGVWQWDLWQPGMGLVDFTNPEACQWYEGKLKALLDMGVDCFKTDFGERIPTDVEYYDGSDPQKMHNYYTFQFNKLVFDLLVKERGEGDAVLFARSATAGSQQFPVHWGGDCSANYPSMAESLRGGLSLGLSGFGFWSHDIGGFEHTATADLYKRWTAFGLLSSHSRLHGSQSYRVPWLFDEEAVDVMRHFTKLKCSLMPYIFAEAVKTTRSGTPMMRGMILEFPDDPGCDYLDRQYMLGDSLLIAPIFSEKGNVAYYLPEGTWTNFLSNQEVIGGRWVKENHDYFSLPIMVRPNSLIAVGADDTRPDYDFANGVTLHLFQLGDGNTAEIAVCNQAGAAELQVKITRDGESYTVQADGEKPWQLLLRGINGSLNLASGEAQQEDSGIRILPSTNHLDFFVSHV